MECLVSVQNYVWGNCFPAKIHSAYSSSQRCGHTAVYIQDKAAHDCRNALTNDHTASTANHFVDVTVTFLLLQRLM